MSWLTGNEISKQYEQGNIKIDPFDSAQINPNSYDYRLGNELKILKFNSEFEKEPCIDPRLPMQYETIQIPTTGFLLQTPLAYIGYTQEKFGSNVYASLVTGKSSIGRLFIKNHACAGLVDQGFYGHITLEITAKLPVLVFPGMRFGQIFWFLTEGDALLYNGRYHQHNKGLPSQVGNDWNGNKWK